MAVIEKIRDIFLPDDLGDPETVASAEPTSYKILPLTEKNLHEVLNLNLRCFRHGENYTTQTFQHLLTAPNILGYRISTAEDKMAGFIFVVANSESVAHITTVGVAPEHRKRGLAKLLLKHAEKALRARNYDSAVLEVRVSNYIAQNLYHRLGYSIIQKINGYYENSEDAYLMAKSL